MFRRLTHTAVQAAIAAFMMASELAGAAASPVLAWHKVFQAAGDMATAGLVCDASGSAYLAYTFNQSSGTVVHLAKITPNAAVLFDKTITFDRAFTNPVLVISPIINNVQYLYLAGALTDATNRKIVYVNKYSTDGASLSGTSRIYWAAGRVLRSLRMRRTFLRRRTVLRVRATRQ